MPVDWSDPAENGVEVFSTCPPKGDETGPEYLRRVEEVSRWSDEHGCRGILIYADNRQVDPWLVAHVVVRSTRGLSPLVAVQPAYAHPFTVAKTVASLACLHGRKAYLNMVAGGFKNDLMALDDPTPHDRRYDRLTEYTRIVLDLLRDPDPVTFEGEFYRVKNLRMTPAVPAGLFPEVFVSGSSDAGRAAARSLGATAIKYPGPAEEEETAGPVEDGVASAGFRVGIIARERGADAWETALDRFPEDRRGQLTHQLAMKVSDSVWHEQLSRMGERDVSERSPYWLVPFENYKTMCPYLVGSYDTVAEELSRYLRLGYRTLILDIPRAEEDLAHTRAALRRATEAAAA